MAKKQSLEALRAQRLKAEHELRVIRQNLQIIQHKEHEMNRRLRTHRLCMHGGMLERYLRPDDYTDEQIEQILSLLFHRQSTFDLMEQVKQSSESPAESPYA